MGVLVHDPDKVGRDAGDLAGTVPLGVTATGHVRRITSVRTQELFSYADYPVTFTMFDMFGFRHWRK